MINNRHNPDEKTDEENYWTILACLVAPSTTFLLDHTTILSNNKSKVEALSEVRSSSARDVFGEVIPMRDVGQNEQIFKTPPFKLIWPTPPTAISA
jgi:hypothetical protein